MTRQDIFLAALFWFAGHLPGSLQSNALRAPEIDLSLINSEHLETGIVNYVSRRDRRGGWQKPVNLQSLNTTGSDLMPRFSPDGRQLYYVSSGAAGAFDVNIKRADIKTALQP